MQSRLTISNGADSLKRFRKTAWRCQATFQTPLPNPRRFVDDIVASIPELRGGSVTIDQVIFEPRHLVPDPRPFVIYADHDQYATFFAQTKGNLNRVIVPLKRSKFRHVEDFTRGL